MPQKGLKTAENSQNRMLFCTYKWHFSGQLFFQNWPRGHFFWPRLFSHFLWSKLNRPLATFSDQNRPRNRVLYVQIDKLFSPCTYKLTVIFLIQIRPHRLVNIQRDHYNVRHRSTSLVGQSLQLFVLIVRKPQFKSMSLQLLPFHILTSLSSSIAFEHFITSFLNKKKRA